MTDAEIIKALEECTGVICLEISCDKCPNNYYGTCKEHIHRKTLDLINRQKAEIKALINGQETLQKHIAEKDAEIDILIRKKDALRDEIAEQQAEIERLKEFCDIYSTEGERAIKEFAERLKKRIGDSHFQNYGLAILEILDLVKEMTEQ